MKGTLHGVQNTSLALRFLSSHDPGLSFAVNILRRTIERVTATAGRLYSTFCLLKFVPLSLERPRYDRMLTFSERNKIEALRIADLAM